MPPWRWHNYRAQWSMLYQQISPHHNDIISIFRQKSSINYYNTCTCLCPSQQWCHMFVQNVVLFLCFIFIWKGIFSVKKTLTTFVIVQTFFYTFIMFNENTIHLFNPSFHIAYIHVLEFTINNEIFMINSIIYSALVYSHILRGKALWKIFSI